MAVFGEHFHWIRRHSYAAPEEAKKFDAIDKDFCGIMEMTARTQTC